MYAAAFGQFPKTGRVGCEIAAEKTRTGKERFQTMAPQFGRRAKTLKDARYLARNAGFAVAE